HVFAMATLSLYFLRLLPAHHSLPTRRSSDLGRHSSPQRAAWRPTTASIRRRHLDRCTQSSRTTCCATGPRQPSRSPTCPRFERRDRKSTRLNSSHVSISYAVFCLKQYNQGI